MEHSATDQMPRVETDPELVVLPSFEVRSRPLARGLEEAIAKSRPVEPRKPRKLGTGVITKDFGQVRVGVMTVFWVPFQVGLTW